MAREFADDASDRLVNSNAVLTTGPCTLSAWIYPDTTTQQGWINIHESGTAIVTGFRLTTQSGFVLAVQVDDGHGGANAIKSGLGTGSWQHCAAQFISTTSRYAWLDGSKGSEHTGTEDWPTEQHQTSIGAWEDTVWNGEADGRIAEAAVWSVALSDAEIVSLSQGASPMMVRPQSLAAYWPLHEGSGAGGEKDWVGGFDLTESGSVTAVAHPARIVYPHIEAAPIRFPRFFDRDWVGEHPMRHFGEVTTDAHPAQMKYPHPPQAIYLLSEPVVGVPNSLALLGVGR